MEERVLRKGTMKTKKCSNCGIEKSLENFYQGKSYAHGIASVCKECQIEYQKQRYHSNIEVLREYQKNHFRENGERYREYKREHYKKTPEIYIEKRKVKYNKKRFSGNKYIVLERDKYKCQKCGADASLVVNHKDGSGRGKIINNNNLDNLVTLCNSCHPKLHWKIRKGA